jgi:hypothetical protein
MSRDLFLAILSMDAYNRGYDPNLRMDNQFQLGLAQIGFDSSILGTDPALGGRVDQANSFYAVSYNVSGVPELSGASTVISYRGKDSGWDVPAFLTGAGNPFNNQAFFAGDFYKLLNNQSASANSGILLTGHSLGGGLAGLIGSAFGVSSVVFDNMPFEDAATALLTGADGPDSVERGHFFGSETALPAPDFSLYSGYKTTGEVLDLLAARSTSRLTSLDSYGGFRDPIDLHSMALLATLMYANDNGLTDWHSIGRPLLNAMFNSSIADALNIRANGGSSGDANAMLMQIAYSAIDEGVMPFGDTGIAALFSGADELGRLYSKSDLNSLISSSDVRDALSKIDVEYAGWLANKADQDSSHRFGQIKYDDDQSALTVDFSDAYWKVNGETLERSKIVGRQDIIDAAIDASGDSDWIEQEINTKWGGSTDQLARFVMSTTNEAPTLDGTIGSELSDTDGAFLYSAGGDGLFTGTAGNDLIIASTGNDTIYGGGGTDVIFGGGGDDEIDFGGANASQADDFVDGGDGQDTVKFNAIGGSGVELNVDTAQSDSGAGVQLQTSGPMHQRVTFTNVSTLKLSEQKDTVHLTPGMQNPTDEVTIDAGTQPVGTGDVLDLSNMSVAASGKAAPSYELSPKDSFTPTGVDFDHGHLLGLDNLSFKNFEILNGTDENDYVAYARDFKNVNLGAGDDVAGGLVGDVLPDQQGMPRNRWVRLDMGTGADTVLGGLARGSDVYLGSDHDVDKVMNVMNDVRINQAGTEDGREGAIRSGIGKSTRSERVCRCNPSATSSRTSLWMSNTRIIASATST